MLRACTAICSLSTTLRQLLSKNEIMAIRIMSASTKTGIVVTGMVLSVFLGFGAVFVAGEVGALIAALVVTGALAVFCGRTFRGEGEPVQQARPAWKLTAGITSSLVVSVLAALYAFALMLSEPSEPQGLSATVAGPFYVVVAIAYFFSAWNLRRELSSRRRA